MNIMNFKSFTFVIVCCFLLSITHSQSNWQSQQPTCSSRILSLIPKTLKFHNQINGTKQLSCKASKLPQFVGLDEKCYLIVSPHGPGDHMIEVEMSILQKNTNISTTIIVPYTLSITKIRYSTTTGQQVQYDISLNRIITIEPLTQTSWLVKPGQAFYTQFKVSSEMNKLFDKVFYEFLGLPQGLVGNQLTGEIKGRINVPSGYYPFAVRVYDFEGNSQTIETTIMVNNQYDYFIPEQYQQEIQLKQELARVEAQIKDNSFIISDTKSKIQKKLQLLSVIRRQLQELTVQQRKLQNTEKSLAYAMNWTKTNLELNKKKFQSAEQTFNDFNTQVNDFKRAYQTSVFAIQQKQSQIQKQQLEADRKFDLYLQADKEYAKVRIQLDECERNNQKVSNQVMNNLKQLQRANFVQNLVDIIKNN